jgi:hypothetical protein
MINSIIIIISLESSVCSHLPLVCFLSIRPPSFDPCACGTAVCYDATVTLTHSLPILLSLQLHLPLILSWMTIHTADY